MSESSTALPDPHAPERGGATSLAGSLGQKSVQVLIQEVTEAVRNTPGNLQVRWLLFQLMCVTGDWTRALKQLQVWATLPEQAARNAPTAQLYRGLIQSELFRAEVFAGKRQPGFIDTPPQWLLGLLEANAVYASGDLPGSDRLRSTALDLAPLSGGKGPATGKFDWMCDSDTRLGPVCEIAVSGGYRWVPFEQMKAISVSRPVNLLDLIWCPAVMTLLDDTVLRGYMPARYPGSESAADDVQLGRTTTWQDCGEATVIGLGQKTWSTDQGDWGVLELGECRFGAAHGSR